MTVRLLDDASGEKNEWRYEDCLSDYLRGELVDRELLPPQLFIGSQKKDNEVVDWAAAWVPDGDLVQESYVNRSEEHTSELQSLMRISYAVFCLKKNTNTDTKLKKSYHAVRSNNATVHTE